MCWCSVYIFGESRCQQQKSSLLSIHPDYILQNLCNATIRNHNNLLNSDPSLIPNIN
jgi:hypothetical protein